MDIDCHGIFSNVYLRRFLPASVDDLRPDAQEQLLAPLKSCLAVIELAVNREAEKLSGVEGLGPFDGS